MNSAKGDLVCLVADKDAQMTMEGILSRPKDLRIRPIQFKIVNNPMHDPSTLRCAADLMRPYIRRYAYCLVTFDRAGCGRDESPANEIEYGVIADLSRNGWANRCDAIVIDPELEAWVWSASRHVDLVLGWGNRHPGLKAWLASQGKWPVDQAKPSQPKEAMEAALRDARVQRSSSLFKQLAEHVRFDGCTDQAFCKLRNRLREWFGTA